METIHGLNINGPAIIGTGVAFTILAVLAVGLRFTSKRITGVKYGVDDWLLLASLILYFVAEVLVIRCGCFRGCIISAMIYRLIFCVQPTSLAAKPCRLTTIDTRSTFRYEDIIPPISKTHQLTQLQYVYIYSVFYFPVIALALASVLFLYRRIFYPSHIRYTSLVLAAVCFAWCTAALVIEIGFPGHKIAYFFPGASTTTFNVTYLTFWLAMGIIETLLEIIILLLPLREIARLQLSRRKKYLLSIIFSLGGFVIITAIIRLSILYRPTKPDLDLTKGDIWFNVHLGTGIISACLPTFRPLISRSSSFLQSFSSRKGSYTTDQSGSALDNMKSRLREANEHGKSETEGIVMQPKKENLQGSYADARWSEGSNSPSGAWQEDGAVTAGEAIAVRRTVEVV